MFEYFVKKKMLYTINNKEGISNGKIKYYKSSRTIKEKDGKKWERNLCIKIDDEVKKITKYLERIIQTGEFKNIYIMISGRCMKNNSNLEFLIKNLSKVSGYKIILSLEYRELLVNETFYNILEIQKIIKGQFFG